jgi:hypothetical protein
MSWRYENKIKVAQPPLPNVSARRRQIALLFGGCGNPLSSRALRHSYGFRLMGTPPSGEQNGAASRLRQWFSENRKSCYASFCRSASSPSRRRPRARVSGRRSAREIWSKEKWSLAALQAADFSQNDQRIVWKCLEKKAQNLEMFGVDLEKRAEPEVRRREEASRRARSPRLGLR